jgi:hypothetical protein
VFTIGASFAGRWQQAAILYFAKYSLFFRGLDLMWIELLGNQLSWRRRMTVIVALCAYLFTAVGMPMPVYRAQQETSGAAYPCQHHACGCPSADQCWKQCCCYTPREKLAWAREHGVEAPAFLVAEVAAEEARDMVVAHSADKAPAKRSCCAHHPAGPAHDHSCEHGCAHEEHEDAPSLEVTFVSGVMAQKCQGLSTLWTVSGATLPPPRNIIWQFQWDVVEWLACDATLDNSLDSSPPVPPPPRV